MDSDTINKSFTKAFNTIQKAADAASEDDELALNMCIAQARALLDEPAIPRFHRIKTLLLLTSMVGDWDEAFEYHRQADIMYRVVRANAEKGANSNPDVEMALAGLKQTLEELRECLANEASADFVEPEESTDDAGFGEGGEFVGEEDEEDKPWNDGGFGFGEDGEDAEVDGEEDKPW